MYGRAGVAARLRTTERWLANRGVEVKPRRGRVQTSAVATARTLTRMVAENTGTDLGSCKVTLYAHAEAARSSDAFVSSTTTRGNEDFLEPSLTGNAKPMTEQDRAVGPEEAFEDIEAHGRAKWLTALARVLEKSISYWSGTGACAQALDSDASNLRKAARWECRRSRIRRVQTATASLVIAP